MCSIVIVPVLSQNDDISKAADDPKFCLAERDGKLCLKRDHSYFYQVWTIMYESKLLNDTLTFVSRYNANFFVHKEVTATL